MRPPAPQTAAEMKGYFESLPSDIQDLLLDEHFQKQVAEICTENGAGTHAEVVTNVTISTLMATQPIKGFVGRIVLLTHIPPATAQKIADAINENIFRPVRQSLINIHEIPQSEQAEIPAVEPHFEHLLEIHTPGMIALSGTSKPQVAPGSAPTATPTPVAMPKTLAEQKMSRPTSLPPQISHTSNEIDPYREPIA